MEIVGVLSLICMGIGTVIALIYGIKLLIMAFKTSALWGLGYLFVPFVNLIFIIKYWEETKTPFLRGLLAIPFFLVPFVLTLIFGEPVQPM